MPKCTPAKHQDNKLLATSTSSPKLLANRIPLSILVAEDNNINQVIAKKLFAKLGYQVDLAVDGIEAVKSAGQKEYDVIFMDIQMPHMDGVEATKQIIALCPNNPPAIIAMTANVLAHDRKRCFDSGMVDFINKPIDLNDLIKAIEALNK